MPCLYILEKGPDPSFDEAHEISYTLVYIPCVKIYLNWSGSFGEEYFQILSLYFYSHFHLIVYNEFPLQKSMMFYVKFGKNRHGDVLKKMCIITVFLALKFTIYNSPDFMLSEPLPGNRSS